MVIDVSSKETIIKFIALNFLDLIFEANDNIITNHYNEIINNEGFFKLIKAIFSDKKVAKLSMQGITDRFARGELLNFFENLNTCKTKEDFDVIYKNRRIIQHLVTSIKYIYKL